MMMIPRKDMQFMQMAYPSVQTEAPTAATASMMAFMFLAIIHTGYSMWVLLLDVSSIMLLFQSGQIAMAAIFLLVGIMKHICQLLWFIKIFAPTTIGNLINLIVSATTMLLILASLGAYIVMLYKETNNLIEVMMHPFVIEFGSFVIANMFMIANSFPVTETEYIYAPAQSFPQMEMMPIEPKAEIKQQQPAYFYAAYP